MGVAGNGVGAVVRTGALVVAIAIAGLGNAPAFACAYEDPSAADFQQGVVSTFYPNSLYVLGALTQAQLKGIIPSEPAPRANYLAGYLKTDHSLHLFGDALRDQRSQDGELAFTLVLIEPMLWARFQFDGGRATTFVHVDGPEPDDVVVWTAEAALREIAGHRMSFARAEELGLVRFYGDEAKIGRVRKAIEFRWNDPKSESLL